MTTIDDPIKAVQQQFANEERASDPVFPRVARLVQTLSASLPLEPVLKAFGGISGAVLAHLQADRNEKMDLLINTIIAEFQRLERRVEASEASIKARFEQWTPLVVDGLNRAERTRSKDRIMRIGFILSNSLTSPAPIDSDNVEEMMRIAMELSDRDIYYLKELLAVEGGVVEAGGRIDRFSAWMSWPKGPWGEQINGEIDSVFSKLESFGLVVRLAPPNNLTLNADFQNRYALLRKGLDFARFAQQTLP